MGDKPKANLDAIFKPTNIAVVGASKKPGKIGTEIIRNLFDYEFNGTIFPVNEKSHFIRSTKCYPSLADIPDPVDMAIISVPRAGVRGVVERCRDKGVRGLVIITAGFRETGTKGALAEAELAEIVDEAGMIAVGPNCMGVINTDPKIRMNATFGPRYVLPGTVSFLSQSGALGVVIIEQATELGLGLRMFVSQGNRMDASADQFLDYWHKDPGTEVILMYIESFGDPREFPRIARRVARDKPIVVLKSGRSTAGARAASSHTGALAGADAAYDALFKQCGVMRVYSIEELFDVGKAFTLKRLPAGNGVAVLTNAGGPAIMAADTLSALGLNIPPLAETTREQLASFLPAEAALSNPVDMIASATPESYGKCMRALLADPGVDILMTIFVAPPTTDPSATLQVIAEVCAEEKSKPIVVCLMGRIEQLSQAQMLQRANVPVYVYPESAARAMAAMVQRAQWLGKPRGTLLELTADAAAGRTIVDTAKARGGGYLRDDEVWQLLAAYGIPTTPAVRCTTEDEAVAAANRIGLPVVMKISTPRIVHKSDAGGVFLNVRSELEVRGAYHRVLQGAAGVLGDTEGCGVTVQGMVSGGQETIIGMSLDPNFGPLILFGLGGVYVEVLKDVVFRLHPLTDVDAGEMVRELRSLPLLTGFRGSEPVDLAFLEEMLQRVSRMVGDLPEITEMDLNPVRAFADRTRCRVLDARVKIG